MDIIDEFIKRYEKEFDFYDQSCRMAARILDEHLRSHGIRAIVTSRAKNPARLEEKVRQRAQKKNYESVQHVYEDIVDLAGVRIALYFPAENDEVGKIVRSQFELVGEPKKFPTDPTQVPPKRFSGYWATHYRVHIALSNLTESQKRYAAAHVEIQVASVLMHAWSEVEHDLVYKPLEGILSQEEHAILDELNGLVLTGEIALERLQRAGEVRASSRGHKYANHYDLAASLVDLTRTNLSLDEINEAAMGRVDVLFELLRALDLNKRENLSKYVKVLHRDFERRPLSEQIIDQVLAEDASRYEIYNQLRARKAMSQLQLTGSSKDADTSLTANFMQMWIEFEGVIRLQAQGQGIRSTIPTSGLFKALGYPMELWTSVDTVRHFRNELVHGSYAPAVESIIAVSSELHILLNAVKNPPSARKSVRKKVAKTS